MQAKWDILPAVGGLRNNLPSSSAKAGFHSRVFSFLMIDHREQDKFEANTSDFRIIACGNDTFGPFFYQSGEQKIQKLKEIISFKGYPAVRSIDRF